MPLPGYYWASLLRRSSRGFGELLWLKEEAGAETSNGGCSAPRATHVGLREDVEGRLVGA